MTLWSYLAANPWAAPLGASLLVLVWGMTLARLVRAWRDRRPVVVRVVLVCHECGAEVELPPRQEAP